jgi:hypothetical protein
VKRDDGTPSDVKVHEPLPTRTSTFEVHAARLIAVDSLWAVEAVTWAVDLVERSTRVLAPLDPPAKMVPTSTQTTPNGSVDFVLLGGASF